MGSLGSFVLFLFVLIFSICKIDLEFSFKFSMCQIFPFLCSLLKSIFKISRSSITRSLIWALTYFWGLRFEMYILIWIFAHQWKCRPIENKATDKAPKLKSHRQAYIQNLFKHVSQSNYNVTSKTKKWETLLHSYYYRKSSIDGTVFGYQRC